LHSLVDFNSDLIAGVQKRGTMKFILSLILLLVLLPVLSANVSAESSFDAAQSVAELQTQLSDVQAKENELQARARQLDEDLKPENIERSLAGVGSTKPEELRELRRRQLTIERDSVRTQLTLLATSRERLESAIRRAEGVAYQQSAEGFATPQNKTMMVEGAGGARWTVLGLSGVVALLGIAFVIVLVFWRNRARSLDGN
jgi:cell division protein FtsB